MFEGVRGAERHEGGADWLKLANGLIFIISEGARAAGGALALQTIIVTVLMGHVDSAEGFLKRVAELEALIVVDHRAGVAADLAVDLLNAAAEVAHERLGGLIEDGEAVGRDEDFGLRRLALLGEVHELMTHFHHVFDEIYLDGPGDRKSTRLNSSHLVISYAVFCLKKKKKNAYDSTSS